MSNQGLAVVVAIRAVDPGQCPFRKVMRARRGWGAHRRSIQVNKKAPEGALVTNQVGTAGSLDAHLRRGCCSTVSVTRI
jgi:hypothetical protein